MSGAGDAEIGADPIDGEIVGIGALAIDAELSLVVESCGGQDHTGREHYQRLETLAIEGKVVDECAVNHRADCARLGIEQRRASLRRDGLRRGAKRQLEIEFYRVLNVKADVWFD